MKQLLAGLFLGLAIFVPQAGAGRSQTLAFGTITFLSSNSIMAGSLTCDRVPRSPSPARFSHDPADTNVIASCTDGVLIELRRAPGLTNVVVMNSVRTVLRPISGTRLANGCNFKMPTILKATGLPRLGERLISYSLASCTGVAKIGPRSVVGQGLRVSVTIHDR